MIEGLPFLYQAQDGNVYHVADGGVERIEGYLSGAIVAFVDGDKAGHYEPNYFLRNNRSVQIIMASSPKGLDQQWITKGGQTSVTQLVVDPWTPHELFLTGLVLALLLSTLD
jgi:hypothetical protein